MEPFGINILELAFFMAIGFATGLLVVFILYIICRVCSKAIARSWFEIKIEKIKEVYHGKKEKEKRQSK